MLKFTELYVHLPETNSFLEYDYFLKEREPFFFFSLYCPYNSPHSQHLTDSREKALQRNEGKVTYTV